jgi:hypothetical protein
MTDSIIIQSLYFVGSYIAIVILMYFSLNFATKGFVGKYLEAFRSMGKKKLIFLRGIDSITFTIGKFDGKVLQYKNNMKVDCTIVGVPREAIQTLGFAVQLIEIDEQKNTLWTRNGDVLEGNDPVQVDGFIKRALMSPKVQDKIVTLLIIVIILAVIAIGVSGYFGYSILSIISEKAIVGVV